MVFRLTLELTHVTSFFAFLCPQLHHMSTVNYEWNGKCINSNALKGKDNGLWETTSNIYNHVQFSQETVKIIQVRVNNGSSRSYEK